MVLEKLGESLRETLQKIASSLFVDEKLVNELVKDMQRALLQADVNVKLVLDLTNKIKARILKEETPGGLTKKEHLIRIVYDELTQFLGKDVRALTEAKPTIVMLVGLFGNGKTTTCAKLAKYYSKRGKRVALLSTDIWRPAALAQLQQLGKQIQIPVFGDAQLKDALAIYKKFEPELQKYELVIVDTAGRDALSQELVDELNALNGYVKAQERLLVMSGDIGQAAQKQAEMFHQSCNITGVIMTRLDGTAKGGGALTACSVTQAPVMFIGTGEKVDDLDVFDPKRFVGRLLGMGDIEALLEKAKEAFSEEKAEDISERLMKGEFSLIDLYEQMEALSTMGPIGKVMELVPGFSQVKLPKEALQVQEGKLKKWRYIMDSCTKDELNDPEMISAGRIDRIAKGSGCSPSDIRELLKQYKTGKKLVKMLKGGPKKAESMMKRLGVSLR
ncbi:signal recognition particle protein [Candidatus Woesearchaeota archaeon]|nr:signal recognition particle protein [Candidatus Woesearchaeota archaeon]